eukprot:m.44491 g.44491  ORF g.44491 m.44491 type:complete len:472 (-) comp15096_c0_seq8:245-1660(-)
MKTMRPLFGMRMHFNAVVRLSCRRTRCTSTAVPPTTHILKHGPIKLTIDKGGLFWNKFATFSIAVGTPLALGAVAVYLVHANSSEQGPEINLIPACAADFQDEFKNTVKHQASYTKLKTLIEDDKFMDCVVVCGPQNAGKSWTTKHVLSEILKERANGTKKDVKVVWVKAKEVHSMGHLINAFESGIGATWPQLSAIQVLLASILHNSDFSRGIQPPTDCKQRLLSVLKAFNKKVKADKQSKYIVLLDDFESQSGHRSNGEVSEAMRLILSELTTMALNGHVQPIVVSSDGHVDAYFSNSRRMHIRHVMVEWLTESEAIGYVTKECSCVTEDQAEKIVKDIGRLAYHLRKVCTEINANGEFSDRLLEKTVDEIRFSLAGYAELCLNDRDSENFGWIQEVYEMLLSRDEICFTIREYRKLSREHRTAVDDLIQIGLLFKDQITGAIKLSSVHSLTALADVFSTTDVTLETMV